MVPKEWLKYAPSPDLLQPGKEWHVFLSYRSVNRPWVLCMYDVLTGLGYRVFLDQYVLKAGDILIDQLEKALEKSQAGVLIWSTAAKDSDWVRKEYNTLETMSTNDKNFKFVPIRIDKEKLPVFAANKIFIDFSDYPDGPNGGDLLRLLYSVCDKPMNSDTVHFANEQDDESKEETAKVNAAIRNNNPQRLKDLFQNGGLPWQTTSTLGCRAAEGLIKLKQNDDAIAMLEEIEKRFKKALRPKQLKALALARRGGPGDLDTAQDILGVLYDKNHLDPETMGIYARTWMDRYTKSNNINDLKQSRDLYADAFAKAPDDYYTGINAASKSVLIGTEKDLQKAIALAEQVQKLTGNEPVKGDYWRTATIGEVLLIQKKYKEAADMFEKAVEMARAETGSHDSSYTQAKRLMEKLKPTDEERAYIDEAFKHLQ